jgi:hypothetical protein
MPDRECHKRPFGHASSVTCHLCAHPFLQAGFTLISDASASLPVALAAPHTVVPVKCRLLYQEPAISAVLAAIDVNGLMHDGPD